jgi:hypothetical protein
MSFVASFQICLDCGRDGDTRRSAGFQPAVSRVSNPLTPPTARVLQFRTVCRLEIGDTAGWKPALRRVHLSTKFATKFISPRAARFRIAARES